MAIVTYTLPTVKRRFLKCRSGTSNNNAQERWLVYRKLVRLSEGECRKRLEPPSDDLATNTVRLKDERGRMAQRRTQSVLRMKGGRMKGGRLKLAFPSCPSCPSCQSFSASLLLLIQINPPRSADESMNATGARASNSPEAHHGNINYQQEISRSRCAQPRKHPQANASRERSARFATAGRAQRAEAEQEEPEGMTRRRTRSVLRMKGGRMKGGS